MRLTVDGLSFAYGKRQVLRDVSFAVDAGTCLSILGPNGSGKSTLFRCILKLLRPAAGTIQVDGQDIQALDARALSRKIAYIPQSTTPSFSYTVFDMVLMGTASQNGTFSQPGKAQMAVARAALERMGIEQLGAQPYHRCSGGEQQLCLVARALAQQTELIIMDEPSSSLDFHNRSRVMQTVRSLVEDGYTVIQTTHDPEQAYRYSDSILALHEGQVLAHGTPQLVITNETMSKLYGMDITVHSLEQDRLRVCVS